MRASFSQDNIEKMKSFDPELARKAQIAYDNKARPLKTRLKPSESRATSRVSHAFSTFRSRFGAVWQLPVNFQQLELIEDILPRLLEEKKQLESARSEVAKLPVGGPYEMPKSLDAPHSMYRVELIGIYRLYRLYILLGSTYLLGFWRYRELYSYMRTARSCILYMKSMG